MNAKLWKMTALVNGVSLLKIPLLAFALPRVIELGEERSVVRIGLDWRTRNHLGVMYFGALAMGAELSIALRAIEEIQSARAPIDFIFKDFQAEFLRRADGPVHFVCEQGRAVAALIEQAKTSGERFESTFKGHAVVPTAGEEMVMTYSLTLSVRNRRIRN